MYCFNTLFYCRFKEHFNKLLMPCYFRVVRYRESVRLTLPLLTSPIFYAKSTKFELTSLQLTLSYVLYQLWNLKKKCNEALFLRYLTMQCNDIYSSPEITSFQAACVEALDEETSVYPFLNKCSYQPLFSKAIYFSISEYT